MRPANQWALTGVVIVIGIALLTHLVSHMVGAA